MISSGNLLKQDANVKDVGHCSKGRAVCLSKVLFDLTIYEDHEDENEADQELYGISVQDKLYFQRCRSRNGRSFNRQLFEE